MTQNTYEPCAIGGSASEAIVRFEGGEECFLNEIFGHSWIADLAYREIEKVIAMCLEPFGWPSRIGHSDR